MSYTRKKIKWIRDEINKNGRCPLCDDGGIYEYNHPWLGTIEYEECLCRKILGAREKTKEEEELVDAFVHSKSKIKEIKKIKKGK